MDVEEKLNCGRSASVLRNNERKSREELNIIVAADEKDTTTDSIKSKSKFSLVKKLFFSSKISVSLKSASELKTKSTESKTECECPVDVVQLDCYELTSNDLYILRQASSQLSTAPPCYLNQNLIGFYLCCLGTHQFTETLGFKFFDPKTTNCITQGKRSKICCFFNPSILHHINYMFWPVNDLSMEISNFKTGTNWSLLVYSRAENSIVHFNPVKKYGNGNNRNARRIYDKLVPIISPGMPRAEYRIVKCLPVSSKTSQDSGIHLLCNAETVADCALEFGGIKNSTGSIIEDIQDMKRKMLTVVSQISDGKVSPPDSVFDFQ